MPRATIRVHITPSEVARLRRPVMGSGGMQCLLRRMQANLRGDVLIVYTDDLPRIARYCAHGKGGFQARFPVASLRERLPSNAPLFAEAVARPDPWIYFRREVMGDGRIKIGQTFNRHGSRLARYTTDNPRQLEVLLLLAPEPGVTDRTYHRRFHHLNAKRTDAKGEWFWPGEDLMAFIQTRRAAVMAGAT